MGMSNGNTAAPEPVLRLAGKPVKALAQAFGLYYFYDAAAQ